MRLPGSTLLLVLLSGSAALAHGGEDHGAPAAAAPPGFGQASSTGDGDTYEVVLRAADLMPGRQASLSVFVSGLATNEPLVGAEVELEFDGPTKVSVMPAMSRSGIFLGHAELVEGTYSVLATITAGDETDLVTLAPLTVAPNGDGHDDPGPLAGVGILVGCLLAALGLLSLLFVRRVRARGALAAAMLLAAADARAHGGEVHPGDPVSSAGKSGPGIAFAKESQFLLGIRTALVEGRELETRALLPGRLLPRVMGSAEVVAPFAGRLDSSVRSPFPGQRVHKGQVLAVLEQTIGGTERLSLSSERVRLEGELAQVEADVEKAKADVERLEKLKEIVAEKDLIRARTELERARQQRSALSRTLGQYGRSEAPAGKYSRMQIVAPISGVITDVTVGAGQQIDAQARIFSIVEPSSMWAEASVFPSDLAKVGDARSAELRVEAFPERWFPAKILSVGATADPSTQAVRITIEVPNPEALLRPGMFADVAVGTGRAREVLAVPDSAVIESEGRRLVYVKTGPERFETREVLLGARDGNFWEVRDGLEEGEKVVVAGTYQLRSAKGGL